MNNISLKSGFQVPSNTLFEARVEACAEIDYEYQYYLTDHLGNVRVTFSEDQTNGAAKILDESHYYPFGMEMEGDWNQVNDDDVPNRYRYNGKELNEDLGLYDYGARWYDPAIARWGQIDPLAEEMASWSPYNYTFDNPIKYTDPTGMSPLDFDDPEEGQSTEERLEEYLREHPHEGPQYIADWYWDDIGNLKFDPNIHSQQDLVNAGQSNATYIGEVYIDFQGSTGESLGPNGKVSEPGANPARVVVYGPGGYSDIQVYDGLSVTSNNAKFPMLKPGIYDAKHQQMATSVFGQGSLTYRLSQNGSTQLPPVTIPNKATGKNYMEGVFLHRTNWSGNASAASEGCLVICGTQYRRFQNQVGKSGKIKINLTR